VGNFLNSLKPVSFSRRTLLNGVSKYYRYTALLTLTLAAKQTAVYR